MTSKVSEIVQTGEGQAGRRRERIVNSLFTICVETEGNATKRPEQTTQIRAVLKNQLNCPRSSAPGNRKGCDIGYAPAVCSCERANSVDACTIAANDAIHRGL